MSSETHKNIDNANLKYLCVEKSLKPVIRLVGLVSSACQKLKTLNLKQNTV